MIANTLSSSIIINLVNIYETFTTCLFIHVLAFFYSFVYLKVGLLKYNLPTVEFIVFSVQLVNSMFFDKTWHLYYQAIEHFYHPQKFT